MSAVAQPSDAAFDRGIGNPVSTFIPKGMVSGRLSAAYNTYSAGRGDNDDVGYEMLSVIKDVKGDFRTLSVIPDVSYFFAENASVGLRMDYGRTSYHIDDASISLSDDSDIDMSNHHYLKQSWAASAFVRYYLPIVHSKRFALFDEAFISGAYGQSESYKLSASASSSDAGTSGQKDGIYSDIYDARIGVNGGACAFLMDNLSFEVSVGVFDVGYHNEDQTKNQVYKSSSDHFGADFKVNLLTLNFGVVLYMRTHRR